jgi:hypothetical protein
MQRLDILFEATSRDIDCLRLNRENVPAEELAGRYKKSLEALQARIIRQLGEMIVILCFDRLPKSEHQDEKDLKLYTRCRKNAFITFASAGSQKAWERCRAQVLEEYDLISAINTALAAMAGPAEEQYFPYWRRHCLKTAEGICNDLINARWNPEERAWELESGAITFMFPFSEEKKDDTYADGQMSLYEVAGEL